MPDGMCCMLHRHKTLKTTSDNLNYFNNLGLHFYVMADSFIVQDLYMKHEKKLVKTGVRPLTCHICDKELNGMSITAKILNGKSVFLCSHHYSAEPYQVVLVK